jgi:ATP-dependent Lon protease
MARDTQIKTNKRDLNKKSKKREELARRKKSNEQSDDDDAGEYVTSDDEEDEMDVQEYRKFLSKMFPSKFIDKKVKMGEKIKKLLKTVPSEEDDEDEEEEEEEVKPSKKNKNKKSLANKKKDKKSKRVIEDDEEEEEEDDDEEFDDFDDEKRAGKFNIIFTIGQKNNEDDEDEWEDYDEDDDSEFDDDATEDEDESVSTDEDTEDADDDDEDDDDEEEDDEDVRILTRVSNKKYQKSKKIQKVDSESSGIELAINEKVSPDSNDEEVLRELKELYEKNKSSIVEDCIKACEEKIKEKNKKTEKKMNKQKAKNGRIFKKIIRDKNTMNDFKFFQGLTHGEQIKIIKEVREVNKITRIEVPHRMTLLESNIPAIFKASAMKKINSLRYMEPGSGEYYKIKNWVDTFMRIPFNKYEKLPVNISDGVEACHEFMANAQGLLDSAVYGLNDAKMQIMQMLGQLVTNPSALGTAIAIKGPMGTGKTTLVKEGISKILNRPFAFIALGGATDSSFLEGHSYTYEGSVWGQIVQILIDSKCMNPVIYFDELDKISDTPKGEEIAGILTHLTDTSQNSQFHDKYFAEIDFDLSKCLFIFSYNDESKINPILRDRMYRIQTKGYDKKQKTVISNDYLLPKIRDQVKFSNEDIIIPDESLHYIIETHCDEEDGVRNMKRCLEIIYTKLNLYRLMRPGSNLFEGEMALNVEFPFTVTKSVVDKLIKKEKDDSSMAMRGMYV